jgi:hypothetical protein
VFRVDGLRFYVFAHEGDPREPVHVHVARGRDTAKFWLRPVALARNDGLSAADLRRAQRVVAARRDEIERAWTAFFS